MNERWATVTPFPVPVLYQAWCGECGIGFDSTNSILADNWAVIHDDIYHMPPIGGTR